MLGWQEGEEGTRAPLPIGSAPRSFLERQSWRAGVGEASGPGRHWGTSVEQVCVAWCLLSQCRGIAVLLVLRGQAVGADLGSLLPWGWESQD